jgi:uncharacterized membrane protein
VLSAARGTAGALVGLLSTIGLLATAAAFLVDLRSGRQSVRDERGKLRPFAAIIVVSAGIFALALGVSLVVD